MSFQSFKHGRQLVFINTYVAKWYWNNFFSHKYQFTTTSKLNITITRHQKVLVAPGNTEKVKVTKSNYKYNKLKDSDRMNESLLL